MNRSRPTASMLGPDPDLEVSQLVMPTGASKRPAYSSYHVPQGGTEERM